MVAPKFLVKEAASNFLPQSKNVLNPDLFRQFKIEAATSSAPPWDSTDIAINQTSSHMTSLL